MMPKPLREIYGRLCTETNRFMKTNGTKDSLWIIFLTLTSLHFAKEGECVLMSRKV